MPLDLPAWWTITCLGAVRCDGRAVWTTERTAWSLLSPSECLLAWHRDYPEMGAALGDTLDDLFPGSGGVSRAWEAFQAAPGDVSRGDGGDASHEYSRDTSSLGQEDASPEVLRYAS